MNILVTGGAGYIGSHTLVCLLDAGHRVVVLDNLANASEEALRRVEAITGKSLIFVQGDVQDIITLNTVFETCLLYTSPSPRDRSLSRMPSSA